MAFVLSCTLSDRIAAVGLVAAAQPHGLGLVYRPATGSGDCVSRGRRSNCNRTREGHWAIPSTP